MDSPGARSRAPDPGSERCARARRAPRPGGRRAPVPRRRRRGRREGRRLPGRHGTCDGSCRLQVGGGEQALRPHRFHLPGELEGWVRGLDLVQCGQCLPRTAVREKEHARPREGHAGVPARAPRAPAVGQQRLGARELPLSHQGLRERQPGLETCTGSHGRAREAFAGHGILDGVGLLGGAHEGVDVERRRPHPMRAPPPDGCRRLVASPSRRARTRASARRAAERFAPSSL